ncbi:hypothetical protein [Stieleria varia]|nr:hypothetical protein [Stieleria varia]
MKSDEDRLRERIEHDVTENHKLYVRRANQLALVKQACDAIPIGEASEQMDPEQKKEFSDLELRFNIDPNTVWVRATDLEPISKDALPPEMSSEEEAGLKEFKAWDSDYESPLPRRLATYAFRDIAQSVKEDLRYSSTDPKHDTFAKRAADSWRDVQYVIVIRTVISNPGEPIKTEGEWSFHSGYWGGEAIVFEIESGRQIAAFDFEACNRGSRDVYNVEGKDDATAEAAIHGSLATDLRRNIWPAFWQALDQRCRNQFKKYTTFDFQYGADSIQNARLLYLQSFLKEHGPDEVSPYVRRKVLAAGNANTQN